MARTRTVFIVLYHAENGRGGPAGDGSFTARFINEQRAQQFANGREYFGKPATVEKIENVPKRVLDRWIISA